MPPAAKERTLSSPTLFYLVAYNAFALVAWGYLDWLLARHFYTQGFSAPAIAGVWPLVSFPLKVVQSAAFLEVLHALFGLVRSGVATAAIQVLARLFVLWCVVDIAPPAQASPLFALCVSAWALVEVPRYALYLCELLDVNPPALLTWLRYSLFIVLYPCGIGGEVGSLIAALPHVTAHRTWAVDLPNTHNVAYNHATLLWALLIFAYPPGAWTMVSHMWAMRKKKLGLKEVGKRA